MEDVDQRAPVAAKVLLVAALGEIAQMNRLARDVSQPQRAVPKAVAELDAGGACEVVGLVEFDVRPAEQVPGHDVVTRRRIDCAETSEDRVQ